MIAEWSSKLLLFLSADVAGSTKYKNSNQFSDQYPAPWRDVYASFYEGFPTLFKGRVSKITKCEHLASQITLWKIFGDEIIFNVPISSVQEVFHLVKNFAECIGIFDDKNGLRKPLGLKGTGWTAGFPVRNSEIPVALGPPGAKIVDFIGPDMDIGFRLCKCSRPGRMTISMDLADILTRELAPRGIDLYHVGWQVLEGVFENKPYPIIWVKDGGADRIPPWEEVSCDWTRKIINHETTEPKKIRLMAKRIRQSLSHLGLVEPYFAIEEMLEEHKRIKENWEMKQKDHFDISDPLGTDDERD